MNFDLILDTPWWLPAGVALVGAAAWVSGNKRRDKALMNIGLAALLLGVAIAAISYLVDTPREKAETSTRVFVQSVVAQDLEPIRAMLHGNAHVKVMGAATPYVNREEILKAVDLADEQFGLTSATVLGLRSVRTGDVIAVTFSVLSEQSMTMGRPIQTRWEFQFQRTAEGWNLLTITLIDGTGMSNEQAQRRFPRVRN